MSSSPPGRAATPPWPTRPRTTLASALACALVFALVALVQLPLVLNPGYFSHDELQWAVYAAEGRRFDWTATHLFQYRPLTFSLWSWLSASLFDTPRAFHAVLVAGGALNAALACLLARRLGAAPWPALAGAVIFGIGPQAMYVHGWIGTIGDVLWVGLGLAAALVASSRRWPAVAMAGLAGLLVLLALLAKEAAVSIAPLLGLAAWLATAPGSDERKRWWIAAAAAAAVTAAWLAWRLDAIVGADPQPGTAYVLATAHVPVRWLEQQLFLFDPGLGEVHQVLAGGFGKRALFASLVWLAVVTALARAGWRWPVVFVLGGSVALAPALPLASGANQYGYGFACVTTLAAACAWPRLPGWGRAVLLFAALLVAWHGVDVMHLVRNVGERQARFSPAVADTLRERDGVLRLAIGDENDTWIYRRLTHEIPRYDGVVFGDRVRIVAPGEPADRVVREDGSLAPVP